MGWSGVILINVYRYKYIKFIISKKKNMLKISDVQ